MSPGKGRRCRLSFAPLGTPATTTASGCEVGASPGTPPTLGGFSWLPRPWQWPLEPSKPLGHHDHKGHQDPQRNEATKATKTIMTTMVPLSTMATVAVIATMATVATLGIGTTMVSMAIVLTVTHEVTVPTVAPMVTVTAEATMATVVTQVTKVTVATMVTVARRPSWKSPSKSCPTREPCQGSRTSTEGLEQPGQHRTAWTAETGHHLGPLGHFPIEGFGSGNVTATC